MNVHATIDVDQDPELFVSIVIPTRNRGKLIGVALRAIQMQSYKNFEAIVVDDGSDENTQAMYEELWINLDSRFILLTLSQTNTVGSGPSVARNFGLSRSRGEIVSFCDDDDFWTSPEHLARIVLVFCEYPEVDMYIANQIGVLDQKIQIHDWFPRLTARLRLNAKSAEIKGPVSVKELCCAGGFAQLNILSLRKKIVQQIGGFWKESSYEEDRDFFWRAVDNCNVIFFDPKIIAQHNIPEAQKKTNQSTRYSFLDRLLLSTLISQHIATTVKNPLISDLARRYEGDILRRIALYLSETGRLSLSFVFARKALAGRFSLKWTLFTIFLGFKSILVSKAR